MEGHGVAMGSHGDGIFKAFFNLIFSMALYGPPR